MKIFKVLSVAIIMLILLTSSTCLKKDNYKDPNSGPFPVVFTSNIEYVDEGYSISIDGISNYHSNASLTTATSGEILYDSILALKFIDELSLAKLNIHIYENDGEPIQTGTYSFSSPYSDFGFEVQLINPHSNVAYYFQSGNNNQNLEYNGQAVVPNGTITITSLTQHSISGTINAELYGYDGSTQNPTYKAIISNGEFNCDIVRF